MPVEWVAVVPVKELRVAKSRLDALTGGERAEVALAMAADVVAAARDCPAVAGVVVVTNDLRAAAGLGELGAYVVADVSDAGLNPALADGARMAGAMWPRAGVVALASDLPCLTPDGLAAVLAEAAAYDRSAVPDARGDGTVLLAARPGVALDPHFGAGSLNLHAERGARVLWVSDPGVRRDVDTADDLAAALAIGVGARTRAALAGR